MTPDRCPRCGALTRPSQEWCTLCHASLVVAATPDPLTAPLELLEGGSAAVLLEGGFAAELLEGGSAAELPAGATGPDVLEPSRAPAALIGAAQPLGKHARHAVQRADAEAYAPAEAAATYPSAGTDAADDLDSALPDSVDAMLAQLAFEQRRPMPKSLAWMPAERNARLMVTFVAAILVTSLAWGFFWVLSLVF